MKPQIETDDYRVRHEQRVDLRKWPTMVEPLYDSEEAYESLLRTQVEKLSSQQEMLYASDAYSVLFIFQAMDSAGKDGAIRHVMSGINPQGCQVFSFKHPSATELDHDFLWRTSQCLPERGRIGIFNRSYYEEVLIVRVHPELLRGEHLPNGSPTGKRIWRERYQSILDHEHHLHVNGTRTVKFFLHISKEEQLKRFVARIDDPAKNWKFSAADVDEREYWDDYRKAYEKCLSATSTKDSPWYAVPADDKKNARLLISEIMLDTFRSLKMSYPETDAKREKELQAMRKRLLSR
ncbi:MAG: ADP-polyphosphate phosphotransferase [Gemmatimonadota bacterium]